MPETKILVEEFFIAGVQHHQLHKVIDLITEGTLLTLEPEPTNKYDANAIKILYNTTMLGYVPAKYSAKISALMSIKELFCKIFLLDKTKKPWEQCEVSIYYISLEE